jgi:putative SOS response-associated peptidase YedK
MINARAETITEKPSYRVAFQRRRCIVPLSGFYEWQRQGDEKRPFAIFSKNEPLLSLAGIWETWGDIHSFSLITTEANAFMSKIHDRMPVLLSEKDEEEWLDPKQTSSERLLRLLKPCPERWLDCHEVSTAVNSPKNNREELLIPITR